MSRDNWNRLVVAVVRREQIWQMFHDHSRTPSISTIASSSDDPNDNFSGEISNDDLKPLSLSPPRPLSVTKPAFSQVGSSGTLSITRKLFSGLYRWRKPKHHSGFDTHGQPRKFSLGELQDATDQFSQKNLIRHGVHEVYRGQLADGSLVEVKRLIERSENGAEHQFQTEVEMACMVVHPNVLNLLGYCITPKQCMLVYPLMINGSVASCLRGHYPNKHPLNWPIKKRIAISSAKGLAYLHEGCDRKVIHRDVKSASILLDENFEAFLADLDLAKHLDHNEADVNTGIRGCSGVIAPEYLSTGICSEKSDVYGYGLFLLELITWKRTFDLARLANDDDLTLLDWVKVIFLEKKWEKIVDANCESDHLMEEVVEQLMQIALLCTQSTPKGRPKMSEIVRMLEQNGDDTLIQIMWEQWLKNEMLRHSVRTQKDDQLVIGDAALD